MNPVSLANLSVWLVGTFNGYVYKDSMPVSVTAGSIALGSATLTAFTLKPNVSRFDLPILAGVSLVLSTATFCLGTCVGKGAYHFTMEN